MHIKKNNEFALRIFVYQSSIFLLIVFLFIIICQAVLPYDYNS
jgi:hypothetical protein